MRLIPALTAVSLYATIAACSSPAPVIYVALGDSFTAGPFISAAEGPAGCHRSSRDYPHLVAVTIRARTFHDASCSGATTEDLDRPQATSQGVNPPQLQWVDRSTTVVTIGIGGNDIGFIGDVINCTSLTPFGMPCQSRYDSGGVDVITARIVGVRPSIEEALAAVHRRAPRARVFVVGYPAVVPVSGSGCWPVVPFSPADVPYVRAKLVELNAMLATAARDAHAFYIDLYTASTGHDACEPTSVRWVEPPVAGVPAAPLHPNSAGMASVATLISAAIARASHAR